MLDVERRPHVDAGGEQLLDVLPALRMAAAGDVGVRVLVDAAAGSGWRASAASRSNSLQDLVDVDDRLARQDLEAVQQRLRLAPPMRLDQADDDVAALRLRRARAPSAWRRSCRRRAPRRERSSAVRVPPSWRGRGVRPAKLSGSSRLAWRSGSASPELLSRRQRVEREVEPQDVDARLAQQSERAAFDLAVNELAHALLGQAAGLGDARHLQQRRLRRDVRDRGRSPTSSRHRPGSAR